MTRFHIGRQGRTPTDRSRPPRTLVATALAICLAVLGATLTAAPASAGAIDLNYQNAQADPSKTTTPSGSVPENQDGSTNLLPNPRDPMCDIWGCFDPCVEFPFGPECGPWPGPLPGPDPEPEPEPSETPCPASGRRGPLEIFYDVTTDRGDRLANPSFEVEWCVDNAGNVADIRVIAVRANALVSALEGNIVGNAVPQQVTLDGKRAYRLSFVMRYIFKFEYVIGPIEYKAGITCQIDIQETYSDGPHRSATVNPCNPWKPA